MTNSITKVLVANRGEIARRIFRTCRDLGIETVAVFSDADAEMPFVREADQAVHIGPAPSAESYLKTEAILAAAQRLNHRQSACGVEHIVLDVFLRQKTRNELTLFNRGCSHKHRLVP